MQIIEKKSSKGSWKTAFSQPGQEFPLTPLPILEGKIPQGLRGTLYRNGAARLERGGMRVGHRFDGDGAILAVHFTDVGATGVYRYVQTAGYQEESAAGKFLYGNYGMTAPGPFWNQWSRPVKNVANTSVLPLPDKLLALWEGDNPYALDLLTLETQGLDDLKGTLPPKECYSAHPKVDYYTGEIFNFGLKLEPNATLVVYKSDFTGKIIQRAKFPLKCSPILHDFVLTEKYLVFVLPPVRINLWPIFFGFGTVYSSSNWQPQLGTEIIVIDRENLSLVSRSLTEPWFQWHFSNGYVDDSGLVVVNLARYADFRTNKYLQEMATGNNQTSAETTLTELHIEPQTGKVKKTEVLLDRTCELLSVPQQQVGKASRYTYMNLFRQGTDIGKEILNGIGCFDRLTETLQEAIFDDGCYPSEPIHAHSQEDPAEGWILTIVYDGNNHQSEVWIFDSDRLDDEPVCKLGLPQVIPHSFHGTWKPA
ncbi:MAG TPA: carotenoid oxygenase family protein [Nostocaceae cyanobacterium]|nr:carotenoid oxygenase family protein [Nostocaceae cyanobacterium]